MYALGTDAAGIYLYSVGSSSSPLPGLHRPRCYEITRSGHHLDKCECLDASHHASHLQLPNPLFRIHEYLVWRKVPIMNDTVLAVLPGMGTQQSFPVHLGTMRIPARLAAWAGGRTQDAVEGLLSLGRSTPDLCWITSLDREMVVRVMQATCTSRYDDVPP